MGCGWHAAFACLRPRGAAFLWQITINDCLVYSHPELSALFLIKSILLLLQQPASVMAKSKDDTPKKGKKSTTVQKAATTLRRSPRKAVLSAKRLAADEILGVSRVVNQTAAKKTTAVRKTSPKKPKKTTESGQKKPKSPSPAKASPKSATKTTCTGVKKAKSPSPTKDATPETGPPTSPKRRGRPKKEAPIESTKSKNGPADGSRIYSRTRTRTPDDVAEVPVPIAEDKWTDSPKKRSPSKSIPKKVVSKARSQKNKVIIDVLGGIRESIELPEGETRARSGASGRKSSKSPSRSRSKSPSKPRGRKNSAISVNSTSTTRSKSLAKSQPKRPAASAIPTEDVATLFTKARSPVWGMKSRPKSLDKAASRRASSTSSRSPTRSPELQSPRPRGRPRSTSTGPRLSPLRIEKTRSSRSPAKAPAAEARRVRSASPAKGLHYGVGARRSSDPASSPGKGRSRSPGKQPGLHSQRSSSHPAFDKRFSDNDEYGQALRKVERTAYRKFKAGEDAMAGRDTKVSREDEAIAKERGIRRARLEGHLNSEGGAIPRRAQEDRSQSPATSRQPSSNLNNQLTGSTHTTSRQLSPNRVRTSNNSQRSPSRATDRSRSPASRSSRSAGGDDTPLPKGQPSAEGRGAVHSVTNPEFIPDINVRRKNPFFETMPAPEVWHRRMPPFLPFGETPFMEREMSRQISEDLARGESSPCDINEVKLTSSTRS